MYDEDYVIPGVVVQEDREIIINTPGMAGDVAIIGAFNSTVEEIMSFTNLADALLVFPEDPEYNGTLAIRRQFKSKGGASSILIVNTAYDGEKEITVGKLTEALNKIKNEKFDILFVAELLDDPAMTLISNFYKDTKRMKKPNGAILPVNRESTTDYLTTAAIFKKGGVYGLICQEFKDYYQDSTMSLVESAADYCATVAGLNVGDSLTQQLVNNVDAVNPEYLFDINDDGYLLTKAGITLLACEDRRNKLFIVQNALLPNGFDLSIQRTVDYAVKAFNLRQYLGGKKKKTKTSIEQELNRVKKVLVNDLKIVEDIQYRVVPNTTITKCIDVFIDSITIDDIIVRINVHVNVDLM